MSVSKGFVEKWLSDVDISSAPRRPCWLVHPGHTYRWAATHHRRKFALVPATDASGRSASWTHIPSSVELPKVCSRKKPHRLRYKLDSGLVNSMLAQKTNGPILMLMRLWKAWCHQHRAKSAARATISWFAPYSSCAILTTIYLHTPNVWK